MEQKLLCSSPPASASASPLAHAELAEIDLIFVQNFGMVPKSLITSSRPALRPVAKRKWLGTDFSHVIISQ
ncbi:MAG: hypothetical protein ACRYF0_11445 [Janthinobacterium lividum]